MCKSADELKIEFQKKIRIYPPKTKEKRNRNKEWLRKIEVKYQKSKKKKKMADLSTNIITINVNNYSK